MILRCINCQKRAQVGALMLTVEASEGLRENGGAAQKWSPIRTVTRGLVICDDCFALPELAIVRSMITHPTTEPDLHRVRGCLVLCRHVKRKWWHRIALRGEISRPKRGRVTCPSCGRHARAWSVEGAPPGVKSVADDTVLGPVGDYDEPEGEPIPERTHLDRLGYVKGIGHKQR